MLNANHSRQRGTVQSALGGNSAPDCLGERDVLRQAGPQSGYCSWPTDRERAGFQLSPRRPRFQLMSPAPPAR